MREFVIRIGEKKNLKREIKSKEKNFSKTTLIQNKNKFKIILNNIISNSLLFHKKTFSILCYF